MSSAEPAPVAQFLRNRRDAIADHWYHAVAPTGFVPLEAEQVRQRLNDLTEQVIALLLAEHFDRDAARSIGAALASLHYLEPRALAGTQEALAQQLVSGLSTGQIAALYPRLTALLAELAAGFAAQARDIVLAEQEQIRQALVAERRQAQEALRESEARYRAVSELTSDFAYSHRVEPDGTLALDWVTPAYNRITGFAAGEVSINNWGRIMHPDDLPVALQLLRSNLANQAGVAEYRIFAKDDAIRWLRVYARPVWDEAQGRVVRIIGAVQDITERKQAEVKLYEAEARYRTLVEQIPAVTYIGALDEASTTLYVSPQIQAILGFSPAEYQADPDIWRERLHPDDREWMLAEVACCHATGEPLVSDYRMLTRDGRVVWFHDEAALVRDADGRPLFLQGVMLDITERKRIETTLQESELRYRSLVETSPDGIALVDLDGRILLCNQQNAVLYGYASIEEVIGKNAFDLVAPKDLPRAIDYMRQTLETGCARNIEVILLRKDGTHFAAETSGSIIMNMDGQPQFLMAIARDITERKRTQDALRQSEETARGLLNATADAAFLIDVTGTILALNQTTANNVGKSTDELLGSCIYDSLAPDVAKARKARVDEAIRLGKPMRFEDERDGRWFDHGLYPISDTQGKVEKIAIYGRDITERKQAEVFLMRHAQEMEALYKTSLEINSQLDVPTLLQAIVQRAARLVGTQMGGLYLIKPDGQTLELVVGHNLPGDYLGVTLHLGEGLAGRVAQAGKPMAVEDYLSWEGRPAAYANAPFRRVLGVPLRVRDKVIGVIDVADDKMVGPFGEDEIRLVSLFAHQAAIALENARLFEQAQKTAERLQLVSRRLLEVQEEERRHIARELHDEVGQTLTGHEKPICSSYPSIFRPICNSWSQFRAAPENRNSRTELTNRGKPSQRKARVSPHETHQSNRTFFSNTIVLEQSHQKYLRRAAALKLRRRYAVYTRTDVDFVSAYS